MPSTGTVWVAPGDSISINIGVGGAGGGGDQNGAKGANGYCKLTINGTDYTFTTTGSHTFTVPS